MKTFLHTLTVLLLVSSAFSKNVEKQLAEKVATHFLHQNTDLAVDAIKLTLVAEKKINRGGQPLPNGAQIMYVFNYNGNEGFVMVAGDDYTYPVLAYGTEGGFNPDDLAPGTRKWIEGYEQQIAFVKEHYTSTTEEVEMLWRKYIENIPGEMNNESRRAVNPLVQTKWNQAPHENLQCPVNPQNGQRTVTGCVATAMAQIMKYWNYPTQGTGFKSYNTQKYGTLSANFGSTTYQWNQMPNTLNSGNQAVSTLMFHCGVSVEMTYGTAAEGGSYAYQVVAASPTPVCAETAFKQYFGYDPATVRGVLRQNYSQANWIALLKTELDAGRPVDYAGIGSGGGHAWVCDGYDNNNFFHMNWGWGGASDGYFSVNNLSPGNLGAGGGTGGFNNNQQAVIGIKPLGGGGGGGGGVINQDGIQLYSQILVNSNPIQAGNQLVVSTQITNVGNTNFNGDLAAALFTDDGVFVDIIQAYTNQTLQNGFFYNATFTMNSLSVIPGTYIIGLFYKNGNNDYSLIKPGNFANPVSITVTGPPNFISMYSGTNVIPAKPLPGQAFTITNQIANLGVSNFTGWLSADLFTTDGDYVGVISEFNTTLVGGNFYNVTFNSTGMNVAPGDYLIAFFSSTNQQNYTLISNLNHPNPVKVTFVGANLSPDMYEQNNTANAAYTLPVSFGNNQATVNTTGSNLHVGNDYDYYKINLPTGNGYTINARIHDSYDSGNGQTYSTDAQFSYSINGGSFSESYDDVMPGPFAVANGGTVTFFVAPYFTGSTGTYLLDIQVSRGTVGVEELADKRPEVYPNPASSDLFIKTVKGEVVKNIQFIDVAGRVVKNESFDAAKEMLKSSVSELPAGAYTLQLSTEKSVRFSKFVKQ